MFLFGWLYLISPCLELGERVRLQFHFWLDVWNSSVNSDLEELPPPKRFKPKLDLPVLQNYKTNAPKGYWDKFPKNLNNSAKSLVDGALLKQWALKLGFKDVGLLKKVAKDLIWGADIGCRGRFRRPGRSSNAPSAYEDGQKVSDAIGVWLQKGFAYGPVNMHEVPASAKFNGIMTRGKPNGSVRIILNLSSPKGDSVNEGICSDDFPAKMSSTSKWISSLWKAGRGCKMCKVDWSDAYKHISVRPVDTDLQWFSWLGKCFKELCLIFGGASSAGIFDRLAKIVLFIVIKESGIDPDLVCQHLDDVVAAGPQNSEILNRFDATFSLVAEKLGIKLAPRDDPDKSFGPSTKGTVLGVFYDTEDWTWSMPKDKLTRLRHDIQVLLGLDEVRQDKIWSVVGKIINVRPLVPGGRFHVFHLIKANSQALEGSVLVPVSADLKRQLWFWQNILPVCGGRASIPNIDAGLPPWAFDVFTDAAGGSWRTPGHGVGAVGGSWWAYLPWARAINAGRDTGDGRRLDRVLSALELVGPLLGLCAAHKWCRDSYVRFWVDNSGACFIYKKGYSSSCPLSSAIVAAISCVAAGIGCTVDLEKITRCSNPQSVMADALSKADFARFWQTADEASLPMQLEQLPVPKSLLKWVVNPTADFDLGRKLLRDLAEEGPVLGF